MAAVQWLLPSLAVMVMMTVVCGDPGCYTYHDHAQKYQLDHQANNYPGSEVESVMKQNPYLSKVLAKGTLVPTSRPPGQHYYQPVSVVCPTDRFMLKAFTVDNKHCYVIKPQVQQLRYTRCSEKYNRDCHYCNYNKGGVSKCEEDYEWQTVWAYCKPIPTPHPYPESHNPYPQPHNPHPEPHNPHPEPHNPYPLPYPKPTLGQPVAEPNPYVRKHKVYRPAKLYAKHYYNANKRWKRSSVRGQGKVEKISLYLPYQCSCKRFKC
ncbi:hypothetical protein ACOMHN_033333 [Nucella lapillus]